MTRPPRDGFERAEHLGAVGGEQGRDLVAWRAGERWAFQCKRAQRFGPVDAEAEVDKILGLPEELRPTALVFLVACDVSDETRRRDGLPLLGPHRARRTRQAPPRHRGRVLPGCRAKHHPENPYMMAVSRLAHQIKVMMRDRVGSFMSGAGAW